MQTKLDQFKGNISYKFMEFRIISTEHLVVGFMEVIVLFFGGKVK